MVFLTKIDDYPKKIHTNQNVIKTGVIIEGVYCNTYHCFLVAQGDQERKGLPLVKKIILKKKLNYTYLLVLAHGQHIKNSKTNITLLPDIYDL
jgi:hypothetical protein